jgi:hypothetical protein
MEQVMQHSVCRLSMMLCQFQRFSHLAKLDLGHDAQHVIFAFEIVEESSLANIRGFRNILHGYVREASRGKEL